MRREPHSATPATRWLEGRGVAYAPHPYRYLDRGGAPHAADSLGLPLHAVVKTLVMRTDDGRRLLVLMHGDRKVSSKRLARELSARSVQACAPDEARKVTGYAVGGISPFATRASLPVLAEATIFDLPRIWINGGRRGLLLELDPADLRRALQPREVAVGR
jgi:Cys-tRNA(Pro) deacylase